MKSQTLTGPKDFLNAESKLSNVKEQLEPVTPSIRNSSTLKKEDDEKVDAELIAYSIFAGLDLYSDFKSVHYPTIN